jgi:acetamidase/formamidase
MTDKFLGNVPRPTIGMPGITVDGVQTTRPPGPFGGNLDDKDLTVGATLFTAVEDSLTGTFRLVLHEQRRLTFPRAETPTHYVVMGIDLDLDRAMRLATQEAVDFLIGERGLSAADAYTVASIACDFFTSPKPSI